MSTKKYTLVVFICGVAIGVIAANIMSFSQPAYADAATSSRSGDVLMATGLCSNSFEGLWVLDASKSDNTPSLCLYVPQSGGRSFKLGAARRIKYDLQLVSYNDRTTRQYSVANLKREIKRINEKENKK